MQSVNKKSVLSLLLAFAMVLTMCLTGMSIKAEAVGEVVFSVKSDKTELTRGETFTVTVSMTGNTSAEGLTWDLIYNEDMVELQSSEKGDVMSGQFDMLVEHPKNGEYNSVRATVLRVNEPIPDGTLMTVVFKVKDNANGALTFDSVSDMLTGNYEDVSRTVVYDDIIVSVPVTGLTLDSTELTLTKGESHNLTAQVTPSDAAATVTWTSSDVNVVSVDENGTITATGGGSAVVTAKAGDKTAECKVTVNAPINGISIQSTATTVKRGDTAQLSVAYDPEDTTDDKTVTWKTSDASIASVDENTGVVTGVKEGKVTITASTKVQDAQTGGPFEASVEIEVTENHLTEEIAGQIAFSEFDTLYKGQSIFLIEWWNLEEILEQNQITDDILVSWSSSDEKIVTVDENGTATARKKGTAEVNATVTAIGGNGESLKYEIPVSIEVKEIPLESIAFDKVIKEMQVGETAALKIIYNPADTTDTKDVVWESSDENVISVNNGNLEALKTGTAEITAKVGEKTVSCTITVVEKKTPASSSGTDTGQDSQNGQKVNDGKAVQTGDSANIIVYAALMVIAVSAMFFLLVKRMKRR